MIGLRLFVPLLAAAVAFAGPANVTDAPLDCGTELSDDAIAAAEANFAAHKVSSKRDVCASAPAVIPVYWHIIQSGNSLEQGNVPDQSISSMMNILNADYARTGLSFTLACTDRSINSSWFNITTGSAAETQMKSTLRIGDESVLNIYTVGSIHSKNNPKNRLAGFATFPQSYQSRPKHDGVVIVRTATQPGGYLGKTLSHEVGHWVGLYHTFQGGCHGPGDYVNDTPPEASPSFKCDLSRDTCPGGGLDPVRNMRLTGMRAWVWEFRSLRLIQEIVFPEDFMDMDE
ncbi:hypothetical protein FRC07_002813 [Ceratobasidium sp. 392]|nr:hypothetical protein FRC07_002813 [Ceratobasidium sp. 392]